MRLVGVAHLDGAGPVGVAAQVALALERGELVGDARGAGESDLLADLAHARRVAAALDGVADHLEHLALARGQPGTVGADVGEPTHVAGWQVGPQGRRVAGVGTRSPRKASTGWSGLIAGARRGVLRWHETSPNRRHVQTPVRTCRDFVGGSRYNSYRRSIEQPFDAGPLWEAHHDRDLEPRHAGPAVLERRVLERQYDGTPRAAAHRVVVHRRERRARSCSSCRFSARPRRRRLSGRFPGGRFSRAPCGSPVEAGSPCWSRLSLCCWPSSPPAVS